MENEINNFTSCYAETYTAIIAKRSLTASQRHYNKFRAGLALIPLSTDPDGVRAASGRFRTAFSGTAEE